MEINFVLKVCTWCLTVLLQVLIKHWVRSWANSSNVYREISLLFFASFFLLHFLLFVGSKFNVDLLHISLFNTRVFYIFSEIFSGSLKIIWTELKLLSSWLTRSLRYIYLKWTSSELNPILINIRMDLVTKKFISTYFYYL